MPLFRLPPSGWRDWDNWLPLDSYGLLAGPDVASPTNSETLHHGYPKSLPQ